MNNIITFKTLIINGPDAEKFLQGMLTLDVVKLKTNETKMAASCNRKGRVVANFEISKITDGSFHCFMPEAMIPILIKHLKKFVIAAKVEFNEDHKTQDVDMLIEIKKEIPHILPKTQGMFTPQMISLDKLGALDFKKGCYIGQEIVARTQHLGKLKRHMHLLSIPLVTEKQPGDELTAGDETIGTIVNIARDEHDQQALAVLKDQ